MSSERNYVKSQRIIQTVRELGGSLNITAMAATTSVLLLVAAGLTQSGKVQKAYSQISRSLREKPH